MSRAPGARCALLLGPALLGACRSTEIPDGEGQGLVTVDRDQPAGTSAVERPEWTAGDRFVYRRGEHLRMAFRVSEKTDDGYSLVEESSGLVMALDQDLGHKGQEVPGKPEFTRVLAPIDAQLTWPLWEGKRWTCHFLRKVPGQAAFPLLVSYYCDRFESLTVPAGTFECARIWRQSRPAIDGEFLERVDLFWYAPEVGYFVRRLEDGIVTELEQFQRQ